MAGYGCSGGWLVSGSVCVSRRWQNGAVPLVLAVSVVGWLRSIARMQPMAERSPVGWSHSSGRYPAVCIALMPGYGCSGGLLVSGSVCVSRRGQNGAVPLVLAVFVVGWLRSIARMQPMAETFPGWLVSQFRTLSGWLCCVDGRLSMFRRLSGLRSVCVSRRWQNMAVPLVLACRSVVS